MPPAGALRLQDKQQDDPRHCPSCWVRLIIPPPSTWARRANQAPESRSFSRWGA